MKGLIPYRTAAAYVITAASECDGAGRQLRSVSDLIAE
jgi:hypothetical protein